MPGMKGNAQAANPYEGMWGPIGAGNAFPYGGNQTPWMGPQAQPRGGGSIFSRMQGMMQPPNQNPNAAFNRPQLPGQGQPPFMGMQPPMMGSPNPNGNALPEMAAASSIGPSQNQGLLEAIMKAGQMGPIGGGGYSPFAGGNIPPDAGALMSQANLAGMGNPGMMQPAVQPDRFELPGTEGPIAGMGAPPTPGAASVAPTQSGSIFSRMRNRSREA